MVTPKTMALLQQHLKETGGMVSPCTCTVHKVYTYTVYIHMYIYMYVIDMYIYAGNASASRLCCVHIHKSTVHV